MPPVQVWEGISARLLSCERRAKTMEKVCPITRERSSVRREKKKSASTMMGIAHFGGRQTIISTSRHAPKLIRTRRISIVAAGVNSLVSVVLFTRRFSARSNGEQKQINWLRLSYHSTYACRRSKTQSPNHSIIGLRYEDDLVRSQWGNNSRIRQMSST